MEEDLMSALLATAGLTALVGTRIHWSLRPATGALPAVVLTQVFGERVYAMDGASGLSSILIQADAYATTAKVATQVRRQLVAAFEALGAPFTGAFVEREASGLDIGTGQQSTLPATPLHRASVDVRLWHNE